jgi:hypothetical protein
MACQEISEIISISDLLVFPTTCDYFFWLKVLLVITFLVAWRIFRAEENRTGRGDFISAGAISSLSFTILAGFGKVIKNSSDIPMIQTEIMMYLLAITIPLNLIWIFKGR